MGRLDRSTLPAILIAVSLGLAACADDGPPAAAPGPSPTITPVTTAPEASARPDDGVDDDETTGDPGPVEPIATVVVQSLDNIFRPEIIEIEVGTEVVWVNVGRMEHDVTPADPEATWGVTADGFEPGDEYRFVFTEPGIHDYFCSIHGTATAGQIGTVIVREPGSG